MVAAWRRSMPPMLERRTGPRTVPLPDTLAPGMVWNPVLPTVQVPVARTRFVPATAAAAALPSNDDDIAFAPVDRAVAMDRGPATHLRASDHHLPRSNRQARRPPAMRDHADGRGGIARGPRRRRRDRRRALPRPASWHPVWSQGSPRHRGRPDHLRRRALSRSRPHGRRGGDRAAARGRAVLLAKLSLGALALNDIWFGGQTMNPWLLEEGASGSSAGPGRRPRRRARRLRHRQRDPGQHRRAEHAVRRHRPQAHLRARRADRQPAALLVARQARADGARRGGRDAGAAAPSAAPIPAIPPAWIGDRLRRGGIGRRPASRVRRIVDGLGPRDGGRSCGAEDGQRRGDEACRGAAGPTCRMPR